MDFEVRVQGLRCHFPSKLLQNVTPPPPHHLPSGWENTSLSLDLSYSNFFLNGRGTWRAFKITKLKVNFSILMKRDLIHLRLSSAQSCALWLLRCSHKDLFETFRLHYCILIGLSLLLMSIVILFNIYSDFSQCSSVSGALREGRRQYLFQYFFSTKASSEMQIWLAEFYVTLMNFRNLPSTVIFTLLLQFFWEKLSDFPGKVANVEIVKRLN